MEGIIPTLISDLNIGQDYDNVKFAVLQKGVFKSFIVNSIVDGQANVSIINQDDTTSEQVFESDKYVYLVV